MNKVKVPWTIKYTIAVNILFMICSVSCSLLAAFLAFTIHYPQMLLKAQARGVPLDSSMLILVFIASILMWLLPIPILLNCNRGMLNQKKHIKWAQIVISFMFLACFPYGSVLYGIVLYFFLKDQKTKDYLMGISGDA